MPVLSVQITVADPRVSAALSSRTTPWWRKIFVTPTVNAIVKIIVRSSGTALTINVIAVTMVSSQPCPAATPATINTAIAAITLTPICIPVRFSCLLNKDLGDLLTFNTWAILPISVTTPVAVTIAKPDPSVTNVPIYNIFFRLLTGVRFFSTKASFSLSSDSPVKEASCAFKPRVSNILASAGTRSPARTSIISPGTNLAASIFFILPSRKTMAVGCSCSRNFLNVFSVRKTCVKLSVASIKITIPINSASPYRPNTNDAAVPNTNTTTNKSLNLSKNNQT